MIAHIDVDSFFASVLQRKNPHLRGKPLLAMGMGGGCVIAASYEAKAKGVKTGMRLGDALKLCPDAIQAPSDFAETSLASHQIETILRGHAPVVEEMSIDEWFIDLETLVGGVPFDLLLWATDMQREIQQLTSLTVSIGVAPTKLLAKMASEYKKPAGLSIIEKRDIETFLADRPAGAIPGIGYRRQVHTKARKWETAWDVATADDAVLVQLFGRPGTDMKRELLGERLSQVVEDNGPPKSISRCRSFKKSRDESKVWAQLMEHVSYCILKMRKKELSANGIMLWLRDDTYHHAGSHQRLPRAMDTEETITPIVRKCFKELWKKKSVCTQIGFGLWSLQPHAATQFSLFRNPQDTVREETLQEFLDELRIRYGRDVVMRGSALPVAKHRKRELNFSVFE